MAQLLPFILPGLKDKSHAEYQLATYMLLMRLITRCSPAPQLFNGAWQCGHAQGHEQTGLHVCSVISSIMKDVRGADDERLFAGGTSCDQQASVCIP